METYDLIKELNNVYKITIKIQSQLRLKMKINKGTQKNTEIHKHIDGISLICEQSFIVWRR